MSNLSRIVLASMTLSCASMSPDDASLNADSGAPAALSAAFSDVSDLPDVSADSPWYESRDIASDALALAAARVQAGADTPLNRVEVAAEDYLLRHYFFEDGSQVTVNKRLAELPLVGAADPSLDWPLVVEMATEWELEAAAIGVDGRATEAPPPVACAAACGSDDRTTYAGIEAMSNGSYTQTGSSCAGGDSYQCTQIIDKVHRHYGTTYGSNWTGNAFDGYLGSTGAAAFAKGLIPFAPGSAYDAPLDGDGVVWSGGGYGHVGVLRSVSGSTAVVLDQNRSCGDQTCNLTYSSSGGTFSLSNGTASGSCGAEAIGSYVLKAWLRRGWDFSGAFGTSGWSMNQSSYTTGTTSGSATDLSDYIELQASGSDPYFVSPSGQAITAYSASATYGYNKVVIRMKSDCANKSVGFYWKPLGGSFTAANKVTGTLSGSSWNTLTLSLSGSAGWTGVIDQARIDFSEAGTVGCKAQIQYMYFDR